MFNICISSLILSFLCITLFCEKNIGLSMILFIVPLTYYIIYLLEKNNKIKNSKGKILIFPITLLASTYFIFNNSFFYSMNKIIIPILIIIMILDLLKEKLELNFSIIRKIFLVVFIPLSCMAETFEKLINYIKIKFKFNFEVNLATKIKKIIKAIFITIPILFGIILLLSSADSEFSNIFGNILYWLFSIISKIKISLLLKKCFLFVCSFFYLLSFFNYFISDYEKLDRKEKTQISKDNFTIKMILTTLNITYIVFCFIQIKSFFTIKGNVNYAAYARKGFFQLMIVSIINLVVILMAKKREVKSKYINVMSILMIGLTFIILVSSAFRMYLYESAYGYTILRLLVYCVLLTEAIMLVPTIIYIINPKFNLAKIYLAIIIVIYVGMNFANFDNIIAKRNVDRYIATGKIDVYYLRKNTGTDAIPQMIRILEVENIEEEKDFNKEDTLKYLKKIYDELEEKEFDIREYNISNDIAKSLLENIF